MKRERTEEKKVMKEKNAELLRNESLKKQREKVNETLSVRRYL